MMETKGVGFGIATIKLKAFLVELQHKNINDGTKHGEEEIIAFELIEVPDLKNASLTLNYLVTCVWALLENDYKQENVNQVFIYDKRGDDIIMRLAATEFTDEKPTHYQPPDDKKFNNFKSTILQRIKKIYGATVENVSYTRARLPVSSMLEYINFYQNELSK